ncbi:MAG: long-chain-fatty-acid--CoA ligase [Cyanobacteria bacterium]|nr:long-chain-fatty-acid--CoA ligase [Cyanobacteriota bacterium]
MSLSISSPGVFELSRGSSSMSGVAEILRERVRKSPESPAIFFGKREISVSQLWSRTTAFAKVLVLAGIEPGDKVGLMLPNDPDFVVAFFAVARLGATMVAINPLLKVDEVRHIIADSGAKAVILHERLTEVIESALPDLSSLEHLIITGEGVVTVPEDRIRVTRIDTTRMNDEVGEEDSGLKLDFDVSVDKDDLAVLVYTSGTTGKPKGAMLTHGCLRAAVEMRGRVIPCSTKDRVLTVLPLCHIYGMTIVMLGTLSDGGSLVICEKFEARRVLELIEHHRVTVLPCVPAMFQFLVMELEKHQFDISSLRFGLCGGAPVDPALLSRFSSSFSAPVIEGYGLTEVSCVATLTPLNGEQKPGSVGPAVPGVELRIFDSSFNSLPRGEANIGQVAIKGENVLKGYYNLPQASEESFHQGFFLTGDLGYLDDDGYLFLRGRTKELIIRGGQNIYPREVEAVIEKIPEVHECAVVGVPDSYMGERVKAVIALKPGAEVSEDDVKQFCSDHLASYKVPRLVEFMPALPRNSTGKVLKRLLVEN